MEFFYPRIGFFPFFPRCWRGTSASKARFSLLLRGMRRLPPLPFFFFLSPRPILGLFVDGTCFPL